MKLKYVRIILIIIGFILLGYNFSTIDFSNFAWENNKNAYRGLIAAFLIIVANVLTSAAEKRKKRNANSGSYK